jgi:signal transduction histidine kinase
MIENLKIALKKQKKLIIIFFLTIFLPSVSLSIFGIRAIKNEKFRLAKQVESEHRRAADFLKTQINSRFKDIEVILQNLAQYPSFFEKDYPAIKDLLDSRLADNNLIEQVFLVYRDEEPLFPLFQPATVRPLSFSSTLLRGSQIEKLKRAEEYEFKQKKYKSAISLYNQLFSLSKDKNFKAQMLNNIARCFTKLKSYDQALKNYLKICIDYPQSTTSSRLPLGLIARLQILNCYQNLGDSKNSLESSLNLYRDILQRPWNLNEDQFKTYSSMVEETITKALSKNSADFALEEYKKEFEQLKSLHQEKIEKWQVINDIKKDIFSELQRKLIQTEPHKSLPFHHSKIINNRDFLILASMIPDKTGMSSFGILGIKIKNEYLRNEILNEIVKDIQFSENTNIAISDLSGRILFGKKNQSKELSTITDFFEDNFPPWRIELFRSKTESLGIIDIRKSFYFWTILTLIIVLTFGAVLIVRTIAHEMEILKIKSNFVSSVSHEFKTPLTSIKALTERLQEGKVKDIAKMKQYFSVISQDTDKLTRLVRNILDFSKIEEGKKEYDFVETDVAQFVAQQIENSRKDETKKGIKIRSQIPKDIPYLFIDRDALSLALINLLDNAAKFSSDRKELDINVKSDDENIIIEVRDKGIGIPHDEMDKIFDKFYQGRNALRQTAKGSGLGLTLVKHTVEAHGGKISVESKIGQGSTFSLIFPIEGKG